MISFFNSVSYVNALKAAKARLLNTTFYVIDRPKGILMSLNQYELLKREWILKHPYATPQQYQKAMMQIAKKCGV